MRGKACGAVSRANGQYKDPPGFYPPQTHRPEAKKVISKKNPTEEDSPGTCWFSARMIIVLTYGSLDTVKGSSVLLSHSRRAPLCMVTR